MKRYVKSNSEPYDVFMLMEYSADTGPDTTGMDGDEFYCLGKFFAPSLEEAKRELESKYPWLRKQYFGYTFRSIYVDKYNEYFDQYPEDENDIDMNPSAMGGVRYNIFSDLDTLIKYLGLDKKSEYKDDDDGLPFEI